MFLDFNNLTTDQMLEKQIEIRQKITQAISTGMSQQVINQMQNVMDQLMTEYHTRVVLEAESQRRDQAQNEGVSPDEKDILNIGDVE
jgi:hypothetical protein